MVVESAPPALDRPTDPGKRPRPTVAAWQARYRKGVILLDLLAAGIAAAVAFGARFGIPQPWDIGYLVFTFVFPGLWVALLALGRAHEPRFLFTGTEEYRRVFLTGGLLLTGIAMVSYAGHIEVARSWVLISVPLVTLSTVALRYAWRRRLHRRQATYGECMRRAVVVGYERASAALFRVLQRNPYHGLRLVGTCLPPQRLGAAGSTLHDCGLPVLGGFDDVAGAVERADADVVLVLACPELDGLVLRRLGWELEKTGTDLLVAPALLEVVGPRVTVQPVGDLPLLHVDHADLAGWRRLLKTTFDKVGAAVGLAALAPLLLAIAVATRLIDAGPVLFRQTRIGQDGRSFPMLKFRTMVVDAEDRLADLLTEHDGSGVLFKMRSDPRVTTLGRFLRRYSLDELPQLVNVLRGEMSLVGPRPPLPREVERYERDVHRRFAVRPGITGLWQVSGRADLDWDETVRLDIRYVEQWSLLLDLVIICRTLSAVLSKSGAY